MPINKRDLITISNRISSNTEGFKVNFDSCQDAEAKLEFLKASLALINKGWTNKFEEQIQTSNKMGDAAYFFIDIVKSFLVNSESSAFMERETITLGDQDIISLLAKLALLKNVYQCANEAGMLDQSLAADITKANTILNIQYSNIFGIHEHYTQVTFYGKPINTLEELKSELQTLLEPESEVILNFIKKGSPCVLAMALCSFVIFQYREDLSREAFAGVAITCATTTLYFLSIFNELMQSVRRISNHGTLFRDARSRLAGRTVNFIENEFNIAKMFLFSKEELDHLNSVQNQNGITIKKIA